MRILVLLCFLMALLPLAALGHDLYLAYQEAEQAHVEFGDKPINFTDIGWLWVHHSQDTYDWARRSVDPQTWKSFVDPLLQQTAVIVSAIPAVALAVFLVALKLLKDLPFIVKLRTSGRQKQTKKKGGITMQGLDKSKKKMVYKRK